MRAAGLLSLDLSLLLASKILGCPRILQYFPTSIHRYFLAAVSLPVWFLSWVDSALKEEVKELHVALENSTSAKPGIETAGDESNSEWTDVVKRNRQRPARNSKPRPLNAAARSDQQRTVTNRQRPNGHGVRSTNESTTAGASNGAQETAAALKDKVKASGVRRVWGTLKETTTRAVSNTITKVCGINPKKVKRSFKKNDSGRIFRWWFIIRDSEDVLSTLDTKWQQIQIHTSWKLEPCYITQLNEDLPPATSPSRPQSPVTPLNQGDATANQPTDNAPSVVVETVACCLMRKNKKHHMHPAMFLVPTVLLISRLTLIFWHSRPWCQCKSGSG